MQTVFSDDVDGIDGSFYKITDVKEGEPIFDELKTSGLGFESMNAADHRHWPVGRGLHVNGARNLSILINERDHVRVISSQKNGGFGRPLPKRNKHSLELFIFPQKILFHKLDGANPGHYLYPMPSSFHKILYNA